MILRNAPRKYAPTPSRVESRDAPPSFIEYGYYFLLFYSILGFALGISVPLLGAGILAILGVYCIARLGSRALTVYRAVLFPVACGVSFIAIQVLAHEEPLMEGPLRYFVTWLLSLILLYSLSLRHGFLHRFALAAFILGLALLPFLDVHGGGSVDRAGLERGVGLANPNDLSAWFGFLAVYFTTLGIDTRRNFLRVVSWVIAIGCLLIVALTVSRGPILAAAIAIIIGCRDFLRRGFLPVLILAFLSWTAYGLGIFDSGIEAYAERGMEETGRLVIWPVVLERILTSPLLGVGLSEIESFAPYYDKPVTPHNSFLYVALASGVVPVIFFIGYWWRAARGTLKLNTQRCGNAGFHLPLFVYAFLEAQVLNLPFMLPWLIVTLSEGLREGFNGKASRYRMARPTPRRQLRPRKFAVAFRYIRKFPRVRVGPARKLP